ncbi:MAG: hypothetical protein AVDCRST_MAG33-412 [uncultured Thermomicrobiales bacterium]|uniref:Integral membrane protein n=1 Tax=uncultured Thermomicrobiales bacterium TaxID=1645740 RepID=A0A6J4UAR2_9BACT|nr:MAG: hypothetical protein AVDCRST_MAG33-412 [uncultured Thermomicrobiales bacterium]
MTGTITQSPVRAYRPTPSDVLRLDGVVSGILAIALLGLGSPLAALLDLPVGLLRGVGGFLIAFAAVILWLAGRPVIPRGALLAVAGINLVWAIDSVVLLLTGWVEPSAIGVAFVLLQAAAVLSFAWLQILAARRPGSS